jgi:hypothetical protein
VGGEAFSGVEAGASPEASDAGGNDVTVDPPVDAPNDSTLEASTGDETGADDARLGLGDATTADVSAGPSSDGGCGYEDSGTVLHVAAGLDLCVPPLACAPETCPPGEGQCVGGKCAFRPGYQGIATLPEAWVTMYCDLSAPGSCAGVGQNQPPDVTAGSIATALRLPLCAPTVTSECVGISAAPPMMIGNSQVAIDSQTGIQVKKWGLGLTEASGLCYELTSVGGQKAIVALTDRCGGRCECGGSGFTECGICVNAVDLHPDCPCVGAAPALYSSCCGQGCASPAQQCDWCASNNHPHFDLDTATFNYLCQTQADRGSCKLAAVHFFHCLNPTTWPPP